MRKLLYFIYQYSALLVFLLLEIICFFLIINFNKSQSEIWNHSSNLLSGTVAKRSQNVEDFLTLQSINDSLFTENARLLETIINYRVNDQNNSFQKFEFVQDSVSQYDLIPAKVCGKTVHLRNNYLTLCSGSRQNIKPGMGVISKNGVVGIIKSVTENFSKVLMIINSNSRTSVKIKDKDYHGNMVWRSDDIKKMNILEVPKHSEVNIGDEVVTSGYSISYPPLIPIGKIVNYNILGGSNSYNIEVELNYNLAETSNVYVVSFDKSTEKADVLIDKDE